ncbi:MAG: hypothetical protein IT452_20315 [Planctomycetia bacterium]|nr:hypothetical protein [Planctomycetia bacterium]
MTAHQAVASEIRELLAVADRDLHDCCAKGLSADWKLNIAYNAALQSATAALGAAGFRATRDQHHFRVIQSLAETIHSDAKTIATFDAFRKKRNVTGYERTGTVSDADAKAMLDLARELRKTVEAWLSANHPALLKNA